MPEQLMRRSLPCLLVIALVLSAVKPAAQTWAGAMDSTKPKEQLSELHEKIESLKKALGDTQEAHSDAADALKESEKAISDSNRRLLELAQRQKQIQEKLEALQQQQIQLNGRVESQQKQLGSQFYQQYLHGQPGYVQLALQQQDPNKVARKLTYFSYVARARAELINDMQGNLQQLAQVNEETAGALQQISNLKQAQEQEHKALQAQKTERNKLLTSLSAKINAQRGEIDKLKRDEKRLSDLVDRLAKQVAAAAAAAKRQAARTPPPVRQKQEAGKPIARNDVLPTNAFDGSSFSSLRGKLSLPVRGDILNRFGAARQDTGLSWKGLFIKSAEGSDVKSVAAGRVVFADWLRGFGNLMIIDHGDSYMSLYGNNESLLKQVGDSVKGGDTIAAVGNSGGNETSGLYFELRYQGKPFDPLGWSTR